MIPKAVLRDLVCVTLEADEPSASASGIVVVRDARPTSTYAHVDALGPEVRDVRVGARVIISRLQGISIGPGQLVLPESAVLAQEPLPSDDATGVA